MFAHTSAHRWYIESPVGAVWHWIVVEVGRQRYGRRCVSEDEGRILKRHRDPFREPFEDMMPKTRMVKVLKVQ